MKGFQNVRYKIPKSKINKTMKAKKYNFFKKISKINQTILSIKSFSFVKYSRLIWYKQS